MPDITLTFAEFIKIYNDSIADGYEMCSPGNCMCGPQAFDIKVSNDYGQGTIIEFNSEINTFQLVQCDDEHSIKLEPNLQTIYIEGEKQKFVFLKTLTRKLV